MATGYSGYFSGMSDGQIAELLHAAGINIADSPVAAEPHLRRFLDDA